jgi:dTDP-3-amino-3,4,6-trideoxy-alpha-D-glucose transaminase
VVPFLDLTRRYRRYEPDLAAVVRRVAESGRVLLGDELDALEHELASAFGVAHVVGVSSGAAAIELSLASCGVRPGDEVIVPALTAVPTASAVCAVGAIPVPVDVDSSTAGLDVEATGRAITSRTAAIVPVHLYGRPVDVAPFVGLGPTVIEDAAQAHGARSGATGRTVALSFYPTKNLGGIGDGGAVLTDDDAIADEVRRRRQHGMTEQYVHEDISQNFRMSEIEAGWLRVQLAVLAAATQRRRSIARRYRAAAPWLDWQADHVDHVYHLCVAKVPDRDAFRSALMAGGVATSVHYPLSIGQQPAYRHFLRDATPVADEWAARCVSLPCYPEMTDAEVEQVADALAVTSS